MSTTTLARAHARRIKALHRVRHQRQGEDGPLLLLKHSEVVGGLVEFGQLPAGTFTFGKVQSDFDGFADSTTVEQRELQIPTHALTDTQRQSLLSVQWQSTKYKLEVMSAPESMQQYWKFLATPSRYL